jgi:hypothetical protein
VLPSAVDRAVAGHDGGGASRGGGSAHGTKPDQVGQGGATGMRAGDADLSGGETDDGVGPKAKKDEGKDRQRDQGKGKGKGEGTGEGAGKGESIGESKGEGQHDKDEG